MLFSYVAAVRQLLFCCLLTVFLYISSAAQPVRILSTKDGLPQSFVSGIAQDKEGFIWIATRNGLARYDGIQYKIFSHNINDSTGIASNVLTWLNMDRWNRLWLSYETGEIDWMDPVTEKIVHFITPGIAGKYSINIVKRGWLIDSAGTLWGNRRGKGLISFDKTKMKLQLYNRESGDLPSDTLRGLSADKKGRIWILTRNNISYRDINAKNFTHVTIPYPQEFNDEYFESNEEALDLHFRSDGTLMWGDRRRLFFFNPANRSFKTTPLIHAPAFGIRWICAGPDHSEYFESKGDIFQYDDFNGLSKVASAGFFRNDDARAFLADRSGVLWVGTNAAGIYQFDITAPFFKSFPYERDYPATLLKQEFGASMKELFNWTDKDDIFSAPGYHFRSYYDGNNRLWIALKATVIYWSPAARVFTRLPPVPINPESSKNPLVIQGLTVTTTGIPIVVGYDGSIYQYDTVIHAWKAFIDPGTIRKMFGTTILPKEVVADGERLWITTERDGLIYIDLRTKNITQLKNNGGAGPFPANQLLGCMEDPLRPGFLWIGSFQGLILLNKKTLQCRLYSRKDGLPDNTIYSIQADHSGDLWLSTNKGLCRFNPQSGGAKNFRSSYGLPGDEYNRFHYLTLPDGRLSFGGTDGWTIFDPASFKNDEFEPTVSLTSLKVNNIPVNPDSGNTILPAPINALSKITLLYSDNTITIGFVGLQFNQPQDILYRYRLNSYDDKWIEAGHNPVANYTKLPPGTYTLTLNASNTNGMWSSHTKAIEITILPPWWRTWWAYVCYTIAGLGLAWAFIRFRIKRGMMKQEINIKERESLQLKELDEMKTRFFSNITHEFRTPLTLILGPAEQLKNKHLEDARRKKLTDTIIRNANQLLLLINQLMDLAKLEAKAMAPAESVGRPAGTIQSVIRLFDSDAQSKNIKLLFDDHSADMEYRFAAEVLERIVFNLLSNALKFTAENGEIIVGLVSKKEGIVLNIEDNGIGIPQSKLPHIFDRFYQAHDGSGPETGKRLGTGIGLALVKELVELQGGKIAVQSRSREDGEIDTGTIFTIHLPYRIVEKNENADQVVVDDVTAREGIEPEDDRRPRILLAEDSPELAEFISDSLGDQYQVYHFVNGSLALDNALRIMPDLVISDVLMPVMDGFALTAHLKKDIRTTHMPVILLTAKTSHESRIEGLTAGASDYLAKPFHPAELLLRVHNLLEQQSKLREHARQHLFPRLTLKQEEVAVPQQQDPFLTRLYELIDERLDDPLFGVEDLALKMEISRSSLHRKIKSVTGMSAGEVIRNYRLKKGSAFLLEGHSGADTAYMSGFSSPAYFTKCFREVYDITPGEFVRRSQEISET